MSNPYFWLPVDKQGFVMAWMGAVTALFVTGSALCSGQDLLAFLPG